jgi:hypothetical protein
MNPLPLKSVPDGQTNEIFDEKCLPTLTFAGTQKPGDCIKLRAGVDILKIIEMDVDLFQLYVVSHTKRTLVWHYDAASVRPLYSSAGRGQASAVEQAVELIVNLDGDPGIDRLIDVYNAEEHFLRWAAVKAALALNAPAGIELLRRAKSDRHPHIRNAANRTESFLSEQTMAQTAENRG